MFWFVHLYILMSVLILCVLCMLIILGPDLGSECFSSWSLHTFYSDYIVFGKVAE